MSRRVELLLLLSFCCYGAVAANGNSTKPFSLRLVDGNSRCQGRLQVQRAGQDWTEVRPLSAPLWFGNRACAELDCGSALSLEEKTVPHRDAVQVFPSFCADSSLIDCFDSDSRYSPDSLELTCSDSVRLVGGRSLCSGSLQIQDQSLAQSWAGVCEGALDRRGAEVLCRELGCGAPLLQGALSPLGQTFHCEGNESKLMDCNRTRTGPETCPTLNLTCKEPLRLVGGASHCEGTVEAELRGEWRRVMTPDHWDLETAAAVCRGLDCGSAVSTEKRRGSDWSEAWRVKTACMKKSSVRECLYDYGSSTSYLQVICSDSVRLVGGRSLCSGSLQIQDQSLAQSWAGVCEGALDRRGAEVLCRELGCGAPLLQGALSPPGQTFHCEGNESKLMDCNRTRTGPETCPTLNLTCKEPLRLVGGASRCEGMVEAEHRGEWRRVATYISDSWDLEAATVVCRDLDCGSPVSKERRDGSDTEVWGVDTDCMKKSSVRDCIFGGGSSSSFLQVICSDSVRLVGGRSLCSGSLQIQDQSLAQSWAGVCEGALDRRGAEVLCRELRCGAPLLQGALSPLGQTFHCEGNESKLMDCNRTRTGPETCPTLNLTCKEPLRLVGGASRCEGTVEAELRGEWRRVTASGSWDLEEAAVMCRDLDCGSPVSAEEREGSDSEVWGVDPYCVKESSVRECLYDESSPSLLQVICSDSVRLVGGRSLCSGSLQIQDHSLAQSWAGVCEGALDRRGAEVLCRELGCGAPLLQGALSPLGQTFHCEGNESKLMDCNRTRTGPETCPTLNLTCKEPLRLVGGPSRCAGTLEVRHRGEWRRMMTAGRWPLDSAAVVCRSLDCGSAVSTEMRRGSNSSDVWAIFPDCEAEAPLRDCVVGPANDTDSMEVVCSDSVRLVGGRSLCSGSLQIQDQSLAQSWTSVCEGALGRHGAEVLCRELGCGAPLLQGALSPLGQTFHCEGNESKLMDCPRTRTGPETCPTLQLTCEEPLRLVRGSSRCEGTLELKFRGEWQRVMTPYYPWDLEAASGVCRDLGCGSVVSRVSTVILRENLWGVKADCVKRAAVRECVFSGSLYRAYDLDVLCSGHQEAPKDRTVP
uniref:SRCR domain-containing protein n=1 Tax=Neogobius melanostomus TaxID=47308 RepID=A0A8C6U7M6_9GOBI